MNRLLKKYFNKPASISTTIRGVRKRYFTLTPKELDFSIHLKRDAAVPYGSSPFSAF
jgi:hypothetical protein